ncbi:MAG: ligase-associated DNA damage response endonuclease PdeM [Phycisphaerales bacterium]|nr:ligase-associated DNA damage response endonuclease PdeM [Phycisphaerales bacterium]MCB9840321.1 ligase-associated DNA damage response endonuclease PdeM [Phycisphaeraceae bacterium]
MVGCFEIEAGGERLWLMPERAVWWARCETLIVADFHLGKSQALRAGGSAVPAGVLDESLVRLGGAIARTGATRVLVVGDLLHAGVGLTPDLIDRVAAWRRKFPGRVVVVPGNHDRSLASVADAWGLEIAGDRLVEGPFAFVHDPATCEGVEAGPGVRFTWCGHVHPGVWIRGGGDALKLACFAIGPRLGLLPAFTRFAAGGGWSRADGWRTIAIAEDRLIEF